MQNCDAPSFGFPFQHSSGYSGSFLVQTNFQFICSSSVKTVDGILIGVALNVWIALGSIDILIIFVLPICEHFFCVLLNFLSVLYFSEYRSFPSLVRFILRYLMSFGAIVNGINSLISLSSISLLEYRNATDY